MVALGDVREWRGNLGSVSSASLAMARGGFILPALGNAEPFHLCGCADAFRYALSAMKPLATLFWRPGKSGVAQPLPTGPKGPGYGICGNGIDGIRNRNQMITTRLRQVIGAHPRNDKTLAATFVAAPVSVLDQ